MSFNHAIRITLPYADCKHIVSQWADRCSSAIVYQHDADEEISKTHVHIGLYGCEVKAEALKRMWADVPGKGNEFWSWKEASVEADKYLTYMSKGKLRPLFTKNFSQDIVERSRQAWVEPVKADKTGDSSERVIAKLVTKLQSEFVYRSYTFEEMAEDNVQSCARTLLTTVRNATFKQLWGERRMFPHASHYKIIAGSVYMRLCEHYGCFDEGMNIISELWL